MQGLQIVIQKRPSNDESTDQCKDTKRQSFFNCIICNEEKEETFELLQCNHMIHKECCEQYINSQIQEVKLPQIKCPRPTCKKSLRDQLVQSSLKPEFMQKYQELVIRRINEKESSIKVCPKIGCHRMFHHDNEFPQTPCPCGTKICNTCYNPAHDGLGCVEAMRGRFPKYAKQRKLKYCYKCQTIVIDSESSSLIKCPKCCNDWCWDCGNSFGESHEYNCYGRWNPPIVKDEEDKPTTFLGRTLRFFLSLIVTLPLKTIFWPFYLLNVGQEVQGNATTTTGKVVLVIIASLLTLVYDGLVGALYFFMDAYPEYTVVFVVCLVAAMSCPWVLYLLMAYSVPEPEEPSTEMKIRNLRYEKSQQPQNQQDLELGKKNPSTDSANICNKSTMPQSPNGGVLNRTQSAISLLDGQQTIEVKQATDNPVVVTTSQNPGYDMLVEENLNDSDE